MFVSFGSGCVLCGVGGVEVGVVDGVLVEGLVTAGFGGEVVGGVLG